jgi:hypothetical protein
MRCAHNPLQVHGAFSRAILRYAESVAARNALAGSRPPGGDAAGGASGAAAGRAQDPLGPQPPKAAALAAGDGLRSTCTLLLPPPPSQQPSAISCSMASDAPCGCQGVQLPPGVPAFVVPTIESGKVTPGRAAVARRTVEGNQGGCC